MSQTLHVLTAIMGDPHVHILADNPTPGPVENPVPDFKPTLPDSVKSPTQTILGWTAGAGLALAVLGGLVGWALVGIGSSTERAALAARGKQAVVASLFAGVGIGVTAGLIFAAYKMTQG
ncbi:hypothetical protein ACFV1W_30275 [Kitasatospora sp. NPDC059648]|uniref:hypothetical protein n=1 Tax=Kitasatospora sp. NPDC059648 TaxID=3346894 RepID=UPI00367DA266